MSTAFLKLSVTSFLSKASKAPFASRNNTSRVIFAASNPILTNGSLYLLFLSTNTTASYHLASVSPIPATKYSFGDSNNKSKSTTHAYAVRLKYATSLNVLSGW